MIRKFLLAAAAVAALGTVSLTAATPAAAGFWHKGHHHHHHHGFHWRHRYGFYGVSYDSCLRRRWVVNRFGHLVLRVVNVCY